MKKPFTIKAIAIMEWFQVGAIVLLIVFGIFAALSTATVGPAYEIKAAGLEALDYDSENFGSREATRYIGGYLLPLIFASLVLIFLRKKLLWPLRGAAFVDLATSSLTGSSPFFAVLVLVLSALPSSVRYMKNKPEQPERAVEKAV